MYILRVHRKFTVLTAKIYKEISSHLIEISHSSFDQNSAQTKREISVISSVWSEALQNVNMPHIIAPKNEQSVCQYTRNSWLCISPIRWKSDVVPRIQCKKPESPARTQFSPMPEASCLQSWVSSKQMSIKRQSSKDKKQHENSRKLS